jgi:hypothetical protein
LVRLKVVWCRSVTTVDYPTLECDEGMRVRTQEMLIITVSLESTKPCTEIELTHRGAKLSISDRSTAGVSPKAVGVMQQSDPVLGVYERHMGDRPGSRDR